MNTPLDPGTLRALRDEARCNIPRCWGERSQQFWEGAIEWLQAKLDAKAQETPADWCPHRGRDAREGCHAGCEYTKHAPQEPPAPRIPPDLAKALREWSEWFDGWDAALCERALDDAVEAARKDGWL